MIITIKEGTSWSLRLPEDITSVQDGLKYVNEISEALSASFGLRTENVAEGNGNVAYIYCRDVTAVCKEKTIPLNIRNILCPEEEAFDTFLQSVFDACIPFHPLGASNGLILARKIPKYVERSKQRRRYCTVQQTQITPFPAVYSSSLTNPALFPGVHHSRSSLFI